MARLKPACPRGHEKRQSWTRCRIPVDERIPNYLHIQPWVQPNEWSQRLSFLINSPGYEGSSCGRSIDNPEDVIFVVKWKDEASLEAFTSSSGFVTFLQIFFGVDDLSRAPPRAFFTFAPGPFLSCGKVTIFTLSYAHPLAPEDRRLLNERLDPFPRWTRRGLWNLTPWVREPQVSMEGQLVEHVMVIQGWSSGYSDDMHAIVSKDPKMQKWESQIEHMNLLSIEEVTWFLGPSAQELEEERETEQGSEEEDGDEDDEDDEEDNYQRVASRQLLSELWTTLC